MNRLVRKSAYSLALVGALWLCNGEVSLDRIHFVAVASAVVGAPVTPVSYAGVARRSTVGVGAPGVGATPAPGVNTPANQGGPVNRVGRR